MIIRCSVYLNDHDDLFMVEFKSHVCFWVINAASNSSTP